MDEKRELVHVVAACTTFRERSEIVCVEDEQRSSTTNRIFGEEYSYAFPKMVGHGSTLKCRSSSSVKVILSKYTLKKLLAIFWSSSDTKHD